MRVQLVKGTVQIPPSYFTVQHALAMPQIDWSLLCLAAKLSDPPLPFPIIEAVPGHLPFRMKEALKWWAVPRMERLLLAQEPQLIHQQQATWSIPAQRASKRLTVPMVTTLHGADAYAPSLLSAPSGLGERAGRAWTAMNQEAARHSDRLLAVSRHLADVALRSGFPADRLHVHYQGVDTQWWTPHTDTTSSPTVPEQAGPLEDFQPGREDLEDGQIPEILFVGSFSELKGLPDLLSAHAQVSHPHRLVLVGDGPLREKLRRASTQDPSITVLGPLDRRGVRERMRRATALVLPTRTRNGRAEAAGLVSLEAQACATPVIVNDTGGAPEMLSPACADLKAREYEVDSLASSIRSLLSMSESERAARGREARSWVEAERSLKRATDELGAHYAELIGSEHASSFREA